MAIIDYLPALTAPASGDELPIERGTKSYKIDYDALAAAILARIGAGTDGIVDVAHGGTGASSAANARSAIDVYSKSQAEALVTCKCVYKELASATTDDYGVFRVSDVDFGKFDAAFVLTNLSDAVGNKYVLTVSNRSKTGKWVDVRVRNMSDNAAVTNTTISNVRLALVLTLSE